MQIHLSDFKHPSFQHNTYQLLYIYSIPADDGLQMCPTHVEVDLRNKLRINSASSWFLLHRHLLFLSGFNGTRIFMTVFFFF